MIPDDTMPAFTRSDDAGGVLDAVSPPYGMLTIGRLDLPDVRMFPNDPYAGRKSFKETEIPLPVQKRSAGSGKTDYSGGVFITSMA